MSPPTRDPPGPTGSRTVHARRGRCARQTRLPRAVRCTRASARSGRRRSWPGIALTVQTVPAREVAPPYPYAGRTGRGRFARRAATCLSSRSRRGVSGANCSRPRRRYRGCRGVVLDGPTRDSPAIRTMGFPVFHVGFHPADSLGRLDVVAHNVPIECGGVLVNPGDLILADHDGVVVVPAVRGRRDTAARRGEGERREPRPQGARGWDEHDGSVQEVRDLVG